MIGLKVRIIRDPHDEEEKTMDVYGPTGRSRGRSV